ncbi:MAG: PilZ domain-containing protein [Candidatus Acidiferrales bacterium]
MDKRLAPRFPAGSNDSIVHTGTTWRMRDLSLSGVFLEDTEPLPVGSQLLLELRLGSETLHCSAVVRRMVPQAGMGIQFENLSVSARSRLERHLNQLAKEPGNSAPPSGLPPASREAIRPAAPAAPSAAEQVPSDDISGRLHRLSNEIRELEEAMKSGDVDPRVLCQFRDSVDHARFTAWAVQQWIEKQTHNEDVYSVLPLLIRERMRRALQICDELALDIEASEIEPATEGLEPLYKGVERLYGRLSRFFKK